jgi:hypothetical protein
MRSTIKRAAGLVLGFAVVATFLIATSGSALADRPPGPPPPGQTGNGTNGYEGQPGNQSHNN